MELQDWLQANHPSRGARSWLSRRSGVSFQTIAKALRKEEIRQKSAAERLSEATNGEVSVATLMQVAPSQPSGNG